MCSSSYLIGQRVKAPIDLQLKIIPKILSLEKNLVRSNEKNYNLSVLYSKEQRNSAQVFASLELKIKKLLFYHSTFPVKAVLDLL